MTPKQVEHELEMIIDRHGLTTVLKALTEICYGKAEHLESNWQDKKAADLWLKRGTKLDTLSTQALFDD